MGSDKIAGRWETVNVVEEGTGKFRLDLSDVIGDVLVDWMVIIPLELSAGVEFDVQSGVFLTSDVTKLVGSRFQVRLADGRVVIVRLVWADSMTGRVGLFVEKEVEGDTEKQVGDDDVNIEEQEEVDETANM